MVLWCRERSGPSSCTRAFEGEISPSDDSDASDKIAVCQMVIVRASVGNWNTLEIIKNADEVMVLAVRLR